jgi:hypothetical protein
MRLVSRCLLAAAVLVSAVVAAPAADVEPLLPKETEYVMHVNFKQVLESDVIKKYALGQFKQFLQGEEVKTQLETLGLDPLKDVERMTVGSWGKTGDDMSAVGVLRGKFNAEKLFSSAKEQAGKTPDKVSIEEDGSVKMVKFSNDNGKPFYVTVADEKTVIGGLDKKLVTGAVDTFNKKGKAQLSKELTALVLKQDEKASMYVCGMMEGKLDGIPDGMLDQLSAVGVNPEAMKKQLQGMSTLGITVRMGEEVALAITMGMKDDDSAEDFGGKKGNLTKLVDTAKAFLPAIGGGQPKAKSLAEDVSKTLDVKVKGKDVTLSLALQAKSIGDAIGKDE